MSLECEDTRVIVVRRIEQSAEFGDAAGVAGAALAVIDAGARAARVLTSGPVRAG